MPKKSTKKQRESLPKLSEAEQEIMSILWRAEEPLTSTFILEKLTTRTWALSTVMSQLARLSEKGYINCDRSTRTNYYSAAISNEEYLERESREFLQKMHSNSIANMVAALNRNGSLSEEEIEQLRAILDKQADS